MFIDQSPAPQKTIVVSLSGGLDSAVAYALALRNAQEVYAITFEYNQKHRKEVQSAEALVKYYNPQWHHAHYEQAYLDLSRVNSMFREPESASHSKLLPHTWKPGRNLIFLSYAAARAYEKGASIVVSGVHAEDQPGYPDCRPNALRHLESACSEGMATPIQFWMPLLNMNKAEIVQLGTQLGVPFELTWTCYKGEEKLCHKCDACIRRERAFKMNRMEDPLNEPTKLSEDTPDTPHGPGNNTEGKPV